MKTLPARSPLPFSLKYLAALLLAGTLLLAQAEAAFILVDDQFNDGGAGNGADALDAAWTFFANGGGGSATIAAFDTTGNTTNSLRSSPASFAFTQTAGAFTTQALADGETLSLTLDFRMLSVASSGLRIGLSSSTNAFAMVFGTGSTPAGGIAQYAPSALSGSSATLTTGGTAFAINDTLAHTFSLSLKRTGSTLSITSLVDGGNLFTGTQTGVANFTFNQVLLGQGSRVTNFNIDNVVVQIVPEPGTWSLLAMAALGLVSRRKR